MRAATGKCDSSRSSVLLDVEMHIGGVERVGARTQHSRKPTASGRPHGAKIGRFVRARLPLDQDPPLVRQCNRNEVHRQPLGVGADLGAGDAVLGPALITGTGFDCGDLRVQHRLPKRHDDEADIVGERGGEFAVEKRAVGQAHDIASHGRDR